MNFIQRSLWVWVFHCIFCLHFSHFFPRLSYFSLPMHILLVISLVYLYYYFFFLFFFRLLTRCHATIWLRHSLCTLNLFSPTLSFWWVEPSSKNCTYENEPDQHALQFQLNCKDFSLFFFFFLLLSFIYVFFLSVRRPKVLSKTNILYRVNIILPRQSKPRQAKPFELNGQRAAICSAVQRYFWQANWNGKKWTTWTLKFDDF